MWKKQNYRLFLHRPSAGFTFIELVVVVSIMLLLMMAFSLNLGSTRSERNLNIAQNELISNLRKIQSYTLSSRVVANNQSGQYYILRIEQDKDFYKLQSIYNVYSTNSPVTLVDLETVRLPAGIIASNSPLTIFRSTSLPAVQSGPCGLVAFKTPYAKILFNGKIISNSGCDQTNPAFQSGDDYANLLNFIANTNNYSASADSYAVIELVDRASGKMRKILIRGVTGVICPTNDGVTCSQ